LRERGVRERGEGYGGREGRERESFNFRLYRIKVTLVQLVLKNEKNLFLIPQYSY